MLVDLGAQFDGEVIGMRIGGLQYGVNQRSELGTGGQLRHGGRHLGAFRRCHQSQVRHLVIEFDDFRFAAHPGVLLRRPDQSGVRRPPPGGVDTAVEMPRGQLRRRRLNQRRYQRRDIRHLDNRPTGGLPFTEAFECLIVGDGRWFAPGAHRGLAGPPIAQQPGKPAVGFILRRGPPGNDLDLGPGHRDVDQPTVVAGTFPAAQCQDFGMVRAVAAADVQAPRVAVMEQHQIAILHIAVEGERQIHDRVLQALAAVHRHHLHGGGITVEASVALGIAGAFLPAVAQPVPQSWQGVVLAVGGLLQKLRHMRHIGQIALAAPAGQQPVSHPAQPGSLKHRGHTAGPGMVGPFPNGVGHPVGERIALCRKLFGTVTEEHRRRSSPDHPGSVRLVERLQQGQPVIACLRGEHIGVTGVNGRNAGVGQGLETRAGILAFLHDHREIAGFYFSAVEGRRAGQ